MKKSAAHPTAHRRRSDLVLIAVVSVMVLASAAWIATALKLSASNDTLERYRNVAGTANTACKGLSGSLELKNMEVGFNLSETPDSKEISNFYCFTGMIVPQANIQGKTVPQYQMGAKVWYFKSNAVAKEFGEKVLNPMRYWGIDQAGQAAGIPQSSLFTFIVSDQFPETTFFDAYTVRNSVAMRVSLPCDQKTSDADIDAGACQKKAEMALSSLASQLAAPNIETN